MADLGTILIGNTTTALNNGTGTGATTGSTPYLESISGADDATSFIEENQNATVTDASVYMALDNFPSDLGNLDTLLIQVRYNHNNPDANLTWDQLSCRVFKADLTTALTDELTIHSGYNTNSWVSSSVLGFVNEDTAADLADWDGAVIFFYYDKTRNKGGNATAGMAITAAELTGTYTVGSSTTNQAVSGSLTPSGSLGKLVLKNASGSMTNTGALTKQVNISVSGTITATGALIETFVAMLSIAGSLTMSGILATLFIPFSGASKAYRYMRGIVTGVFRSRED